MDTAQTQLDDTRHAVSNAAHTLEGEDAVEEREMGPPSKRRKQESDPDPRIPVHFCLCDDSSEQGAKSVDDSTELETSRRPREECEEAPGAQLDDIMSEMRDVKSELMQVRELVGVRVRRKRFAEVKTEIAVIRLDRMGRERERRMK